MNNKDLPTRTRIAPSPTGNLHVGTARAALFNELFARKAGGRFIIRLEDTDPARSKPEYEQNILEGFKWLGLQWDEGPDIGGAYSPYRQSERIPEHQQALKALLEQKKAYFCDCPPRKESDNSRHECSCPEKNIAEGVIRLKVAPADISFTDLIRGEVSVHTDSFGGDFVIARALDNPLFHLAVVVDDAGMQISHVIRGEDHLPNTIKHILLQAALGYPRPHYAHLPLLLDEHRRKLSKRRNETSLLAYRAMGILPEAMLNYLALRGWSPKNDQEIFSHQELISHFSLGGVQKAGAIFSLTKLLSVNKHYISQLPAAELLRRLQEYLPSSGADGDYRGLTPEAYWLEAIKTEAPRVSTLKELLNAMYFFRPEWPGDYAANILIWKKSDHGKTVVILDKLITKIKSIADEDFNAPALQTNLLQWIDEDSLGRGDTLWPLRVALTGQATSPGPFEVAGVLGKAETLARLAAARDKLKK